MLAQKCVLGSLRPRRQLKIRPAQTNGKDKHLLGIVSGDHLLRFVLAIPAREVFGQKKRYANCAGSEIRKDIIEPRRTWGN